MDMPSPSPAPAAPSTAAVTPAADAPSTCAVCHQPLLPTYYFCPNCGAKVREAPLPTTALTELWIYVFSAILPPLCFIFVSRWPGVKYFKSKDPKAHRIGIIAWVTILLSTLATIWLAVIFTQMAVQSSIQSINADMGL